MIAPHATSVIIPPPVHEDILPVQCPGPIRHPPQLLQRQNSRTFISGEIYHIICQQFICFSEDIDIVIKINFFRINFVSFLVYQQEIRRMLVRLQQNSVCFSQVCNFIFFSRKLDLGSVGILDPFIQKKPRNPQISTVNEWM